MPWKVSDPMDEKLKFVIRSFEQNVNFTKLCNEFGISTKTGYKWKERFLEGGAPALDDVSRKPLSCSKAISTEFTCLVIRLKNQKKSWGAKKIFAVLKDRYPDREIPSQPSIWRILSKSGLVERRKRKRIHKTKRIQNRIKSTAPNQVWTVDFKGWWYTPEKEKCEPLTIKDDFSKFILSIKILEKGDISSVKAEFERIFKIFGLPDYIKSDNGPPFASANSIFGLTKLSAWWLSLGIQLDRIDPGKPYQNGSHERMHLDMMKELQRKINGNLKLHQSVFEVWRNEYNQERPHEALKMKYPSQVYVKSSKKYMPVQKFHYEDKYLARTVNNRGFFQYRGKRIFLSNAFNGFDIGLDVKNTEQIKVWLGDFYIGNIDTEKMEFIPNETILFK